MKKIVLTLALLGAFNAHAGDYEAAVSKEAYCDGSANYAVKLYGVRERGLNEKPAVPSQPNPYTAPLKTFIFDYVWDVATSEKDAYMGVWAKCMDNIDHLLMRKKTGEQPYTALPY